MNPPGCAKAQLKWRWANESASRGSARLINIESSWCLIGLVRGGRGVSRHASMRAPAVRRDNGENGLDHALDLLVGHRRVHGQRDGAKIGVVRDGEALRTIAERLAIVRVLVQRDEVDGGADPASMEVLDEAVAVDAEEARHGLDHVQVVCAGPV